MLRICSDRRWIENGSATIVAHGQDGHPLPRDPARHPRASQCKSPDPATPHRGRPESRNLINRFDSGTEGLDESHVAKALTRPARWKIPNDYAAVQGRAAGVALVSTSDSRRSRSGFRHRFKVSPRALRKYRDQRCVQYADAVSGVPRHILGKHFSPWQPMFDFGSKRVFAGALAGGVCLLASWVLLPAQPVPVETSAGCVSCHGLTDSPSMHTTGTVQLNLHGLPRGQVRYRQACRNRAGFLRVPTGQEAGASASAHRRVWKDLGQPVRVYTQWLKEDKEYIRFINPGDLRVADGNLRQLPCEAGARGAGPA